MVSFDGKLFKVEEVPYKHSFQELDVNVLKSTMPFVIENKGLPEKENYVFNHNNNVFSVSEHTRTLTDMQQVRDFFVKKKVDMLIYRIIQMNDDKYDGLIQMIPIKKEDGYKVFASIVRTDHMESIVIDREKEDVTIAIQSSNEIAAKYGNCFTDDD